MFGTVAVLVNPTNQVWLARNSFALIGPHEDDSKAPLVLLCDTLRV